jgi:hypothetical protein
VDNNCNGITDETDNMGRTTVSCGSGTCTATYPACTGGANTNCMAGVPIMESCNGLDDDCDTMTDEGGAGLCPAFTGVATTACRAAGAGETCNGNSQCCFVGSCMSRYYNIDGTFSNGCECQDGAAGNTCGTATNLGSYSAAITPITSTADKIVPAAGATGDNDWYVVSFPPSASMYANRPGVPSITISPTTGFVFDLYDNCGTGTPTTARGCGNGAPASGSATSLTSWSYYDSCQNGTFQPCKSTARTDWPATLYIRVRRTASPSSMSCTSYSLTIDR